MSILDELLSPMSLAQFRETYLFRQPLAIPETAARFRKLIGWPLLSEIFATNYADCWLPDHGRLPSDPALSTGHLNFNEAYSAFSNGRSVLVRHSERAHRVLAEIAADFYDVFKDPIDIQLYATPAEREGFDWHYDLEEVFVIQSSGEKEFYLRKPRLEPPLDKVILGSGIDFNSQFEGSELRCHLKPGDFLYIPAGYWHKAKALTPSFHASVGVLSSERRTQNSRS